MAEKNTSQAAQNSSNDQSKKYSQTLNLPKTDFPIRANNAITDIELIKRWEEEDLFSISFNHNKGKKKFVLHDGPPYANGNIHLGGAYNKVLKDITCKIRRMSGYHVPVTPGWDCHGLPIEQKVTKENPGLDKVELKKACRAYATHWIDIQRNSFKSLGVLMDWARPYITMSFKYESTIVRALKILVQEDLIERKNKTVPWCPQCQTVLASAEIEYHNRKDPSIYVLFNIDEVDSRKLFGIDQKINLVIWTTTPWTLPLNRAVIAHPDAEYVLLEVNNQFLVVGAKVKDKLLSTLGVNAKEIKTFNSGFFKGLKVNHPFIDIKVPVIFDDSVGLDEGTAFVHCAPGCGPIDYEIGVKNNLEIYSPISPDGRYTTDIELKDLVNMPVQDGQIWVIKKLQELNKLLYKTTINHSYPHCWRCRGGLIFRATPQWFFDLNKENIKDKALKAIQKINFIPENGRNFLKATVENRWEWCISRQRTWGVCIPALICKHCSYGFLDVSVMEKVEKGIEKEGIEYWDKVTVEQLTENKIVCPNCKHQDFEKEKDILDVWFDSGVSHYAVLYDNPELSFPADLYLEGVDQHRGWFQSSLLTSLVVEKEPAMKNIMTHGFIVDSKGQKMSKSLGNVVLPEDIIKKIGTDGLRLWVASIGPDSDPIVSDVLLQNVSEVYRKVRNTCRFLLSNLYDFDIEKDAVAIDKLMPIDHYAMEELERFNTKMIQNYFEYNFTGVFHGLAQYFPVELSAFYLDIVKDRLYVEKFDSFERRSAQTVLWYILDTVTKLMAPIMSFTAELISDHYQYNKEQSIHLQSFVDPVKLHKLVYPDSAVVADKELFSDLNNDIQEHFKCNTENAIKWSELKDIRSLILKAIEIQREKGLIKHSLEAKVTLFIDLDHYKEVKELFEDIENRGFCLSQFLREFLIVSQVELLSKSLDKVLENGLNIKVEQANGVKCPRCWQWNCDNNPENLCNRCYLVLNR
ncbi:isoleucine--tRNA ligase [Candidatus Babela massiliensis]|uniref:Isoleucine--tRNA ligase n=1 Tax=Candidatus Babela massiliensis TaxID=673862 RepID=V6DF34_9BACT|nr:isoleucine--tRNA ligase [Candidatus Babela massiliensis]CDK30164.1 Isoleucyl-tRNA synthetase [Candidatus Babela massiliensis]